MIEPLSFGPPTRAKVAAFVAAVKPIPKLDRITVMRQLKKAHLQLPKPQRVGGGWVWHFPFGRLIETESGRFIFKEETP